MADSTGKYRTASELMDQGRYEEAAALFEENTKRDNPHFKDLERLGECFIHLGRLSEAIIPLAAATTLKRGVKAPSLLAEVFLQLGYTDDAREIAELVLSRAPTNRKALSVKEQVGERT